MTYLDETRWALVFKSDGQFARLSRARDLSTFDTRKDARECQQLLNCRTSIVKVRVTIIAIDGKRNRA